MQSMTTIRKDALVSDAAKRKNQLSAVDVVLWICVCLWAGVIFFMSAHTGSDFKDGTDFVAQIKRALDAWQQSVFGSSVDIVSSCAHFAEYTVFGVLLFVAVLRRTTPRLALAVIIAVACASLYGVSDEFHQLFVPGRACDPVDWLVDTCGATLGASVTFAIKKRLFKSKAD
jgi:VanZ family protein